MLDFNFFEDALTYIDKKAQEPQTPAPKEPITLKETYREARPEVKETPAQAEPEPKPYSLDMAKELITIMGQTYPIPSYFNKDMLRKGDTKTTDMVLIYLGYADLVKPEPQQRNWRYKSIV